MKLFPPFRATILALCAAGWLTIPCAAQDTDNDGIPDSVESQLLAAVSPVIRARDNTQRPPLTIDWYVRHCRLTWYASDAANAMRLGDIGNSSFTPAQVLSFISIIGAPHYRLEIRNGAWRDGNDPQEPVTWASQQAAGKGIYGRASPLSGAGNYRLQYFMFFGLNTVDGGPGCPLGNHEGDWICVEFDVSAPNPSSPTVISSVLHNHGRQIFVPGNVFSYSGTHPVIYLEIGSQEPWSYASCDGFYPPDGTAHIPPPAGITANAVFLRGKHAFGCSYGGEYDPACGTADCYFQVSREHTGEGPQYLVTSVVNVGETDNPYPGEEAQFFHGFSGWYGTYFEDYCDYVFFDVSLGVTCPNSPRHQSKMWSRQFTRANPTVGPVWGWWGLHPMTRWGDFDDPSSGDGAYWNPWNRAELEFAFRFGTEPDGRIFALRGGNMPLTNTLTITKPMTLLSERGSTTIGGAP